MASCLIPYSNQGVQIMPSTLQLTPTRIFRPSYGSGHVHAQPLIGDGFVREQRIVRKFEFMNRTLST